MAEYRFAQVNTSVSTKFVTLMDLCSKNLMRKEEVLHLFAVSRIEKVEASENSGYEVPPLQELKKEGEWSSSFAYRKEKIIELMESFSTLQFLKEYEAHYRKNQNFIGLEQNIIYERFIKQAKPGKKLHIVDPSPYLVEAIIKDTRIVPSNVAFVFSNMALCTIYSRTDSMKGYSLFHIEDYSKYKDNYKGTCVDILYFSHEKDQSRIEMEIEAISEYLSEAASLSFFGMIPSVMLDNKKKLQSLSKWLMTMFHLKMITQFDQKAIKSSGYIKWSIAVFSTRRNIPVSPHKPWQGEEVYLQRCMLKGQETTGSGLTGASYKVIILEDLLSKKVPCEELFDNESSIYKIYSALFASGQKRDQSYKYKIAEEIGVDISGVNPEKQKIRPGVIFHGNLNKEKFFEKKGCNNNTNKEIKKKISKEYTEEKRKLKYVSKNRRYSSEESLLRSVEYDVVDNEDFNRKVCISLDNKSNDIPLTCKAAWIRLHRILKDKSDYDAVFCKRIFARPNSSDDLICKLSVGETSSEAIAASIDWAVREFELVEKEINLLWRQVFLIFAYSVYEGFAKANPIDNVLTKIDKFAKERRNFGASMVEKSFNREQECAYVADQYKIADNLGYRIGALIRLFSGISTSELCALVWDDYYKLLGYDCNVFEITKYFADKSTEVIYHINRNKIRQHPAVTEICDLIDLWKEKSEIQLANYGIDAKDFGKYPIIHPDNEPTKAITPDNFRHYLNKLLEKFGPEDLFLNLSDGKGSKKAINVSKYGGDFLRENFRYQLYTYAGMDESEVDYLLGNMQKTTLEKYYLGFVKPTRLLEMRDKLDRWVASGMEKYSCFDNSIQKFSVSRSRRTINLQKTSFQTELEMRIKIPKDMNYIQYHIHSSNGCDVSFEFIKEDK